MVIPKFLTVPCFWSICQICQWSDAYCIALYLLSIVVLILLGMDLNLTSVCQDLEICILFWLKLKIVSFSTWNSVKKGCSFRNFGKISLEFKFESWYTTNSLHLHHHSFSPLVSHMCYRQNLFIKSWMAADTKKW